MLSKSRVRAFLRGDTLAADAVSLVLSYAFILFAAWDDSLLGLEPNVFTYIAEYALALGLACEIAARLMLAVDRRWYFYPMIVVDAISVLTVIPSVVYVTFARVIRLVVSGGRMLHLIDRVARRNGNPYLILLIYPLVVPIAAALFFIVERDVANVQIHNYFQALVLMLSYSLTIGIASNHPVTYTGKVIAGIMLLSGLLCVSIIGNALTDRYSILRTRHRDENK
jgi:hypothetical protein